MKRFIMIAIAALLLSSCSALQTKPAKEPVPEIPDTDPCIQTIKDGTTRIHGELVKLTRYQQQKNYKQIEKAQKYDVPTSGPLSKPITLTWEGPIDLALADLARTAGYSFPTPIGTPHFRDTIVKIDVINTPIFHVIESVGWQAGNRITVLLDPERKIISLAYEGS